MSVYESVSDAGLFVGLLLDAMSLLAAGASADLLAIAGLAPDVSPCGFAGSVLTPGLVSTWRSGRCSATGDGWAASFAGVASGLAGAGLAGGGVGTGFAAIGLVSTCRSGCSVARGDFGVAVATAAGLGDVSAGCFTGAADSAGLIADALVSTCRNGGSFGPLTLVSGLVSLFSAGFTTAFGSAGCSGFTCDFSGAGVAGDSAAGPFVVSGDFSVAGDFWACGSAADVGLAVVSVSAPPPVWAAAWVAFTSVSPATGRRAVFSSPESPDAWTSGVPLSPS